MCQVAHWPEHKGVCQPDDECIGARSDVFRRKVVLIPTAGELQQFDLRGRDPGILLGTHNVDSGVVERPGFKLAVFCRGDACALNLPVNHRAARLRRGEPIPGPVVLIDDNVDVTVGMAQRFIDDARV